MKWRVQLVKTVTVTAPKNTHQKKEYHLVGNQDQKLRYVLTAARDATLHVHFTLGSLDENGSGQVELLVQLNAFEPHAQITMTASIVTGTNQHHRITTEQLQTASHTQSTVILRAVVKEGGTHDYHGVIRLEPDSIQAEANQENKILQIGKNAKDSSQPTLQILHMVLQLLKLTLSSFFIVKLGVLKTMLHNNFLLTVFYRYKSIISTQA